MDTAAWNPLTFLFYIVVLVIVLLEDNFKLFNPQHSLDVQKYNFAYRVIDIWNSLSSDIVNACNIFVFKHKLEFVVITPFVRVEFA